MAKILIVEDEATIGFYLVGVLRQAGYEVMGPARSISAALQALHADRIDAALLDISLGSEPAFAIADVLRERGVPFLLLTGYERHQIPEPYRDCWHMTKPPREAVLLSRLKKMVTERQQC
jgi:DNA-binding response OmpR family regulator